MSKPPECATTFFLNLRSILVGHFGLQSVSYRIETPCTARVETDIAKVIRHTYFEKMKKGSAIIYRNVSDDQDC